MKKEKKTYETVTDIQQILKTWEMRSLTLEGKIKIFKKRKKKSKIVFQSFITTALKLIVKEPQKTQKAFSWKKPTPYKKTFQ